jgi:hypothetical protein
MLTLRRVALRLVSCLGNVQELDLRARYRDTRNTEAHELGRENAYGTA